MIGQILDSRYRIEGSLGKGGMAVVYKATDLDNDTLVALKVLSNAAQSDEALSRFRREFTICQKLSHSNIIKLFHFGKSGNSTFYVMELIEGKTLAELIEEEAPLEQALVRSLLLGLTSAFSVLHDEGVVHRDLKPSNIMIRAGGNTPVLMDFGLARAMDLTALTATGAILGTPYYMSPELTLGKRATVASDIYQLGVITYEMLTGSLPFYGRTITELLQEINRGRALPLKTRVEGLSSDWQKVVFRCLEKEPEDRFSSMLELANKIKAIDIDEQHRKTVDIEPKVVTKENNRNYSLNVVVFVLLLLCLVGSQLNVGTEQDINIRDLKVVVEPESAVISWNSDESYKSVVQIVKPMELFLSNSDGKRTKAHRVQVNGLKEGINYSYRLIFPNGQTSLVKSFSTPVLRFKLVSAEKSDKGVLLSWITEPETKGQLRFYKSGRAEAIKAKCSKGMCSVLLPQNNLGAKSLVIDAFFPSGWRKSESLQKIVFQQARTLTKRLEQFDEGKFVSGLRFAGWNSIPVAIKREAARAALEDLAEAENEEKLDNIARAKYQKKVLLDRLEQTKEHFEAYGRAVSLAPLYYQQKFLPLDSLLSFDYAIGKFVRVQEFIRIENLYSSDLGLPPIPDRGCYAYAWQPLLEADEELSIHRGDSSLVFGVPYLQGHKRKQRHKLNFSLGSIESIKAAELEFFYERFDRVGIKIILNKVLSLNAFPEKVSHNTQRYIYQRIPIEVLKEGHNSLELSIDLLSKESLNEEIHIRAIKLRLKLTKQAIQRVEQLRH